MWEEAALSNRPSLLPKPTLLPFPLVHGVEKGWDNSALHLFKGKGGALGVTCLGPLPLSREEQCPAEQHHVLRE